MVIVLLVYTKSTSKILFDLFVFGLTIVCVLGNGERRISAESTPSEISPTGETESQSSSNSSPNQISTTPHLSQSHSLAFLVTKLFDEKIPFKKKVRLVPFFFRDQ